MHEDVDSRVGRQADGATTGPGPPKPSRLQPPDGSVRVTAAFPDESRFVPGGGWFFGMSGLPERARVVVIGAGIVGNSMAYHLAKQGWRDIVLIDKGPLPNPGGSTGHASNFIFLVDHSKEMTALTVDSVNQYKKLGVFTQSGGIEVARTDERMQELARRMASARSWGIAIPQDR